VQEERVPPSAAHTHSIRPQLTVSLPAIHLALNARYPVNGLVCRTGRIRAPGIDETQVPRVLIFFPDGSLGPYAFIARYGGGGAIAQNPQNPQNPGFQS